MKKTLPVFVLVLGLLPLPGCRPNNAPVVTELSGPPSGRIDSTYLFVAHAADPDGDAVAIRFDWDNGDTSDWSAPVQSALPVRLSYVWPDGDSYEVRCQARDKRGALSD
ncbi:hypothetical protein FJY71_09350, partial [candidate division WOR-3 bacterium]|nr:hypothetical protein [candidate division WOR-3 bacterium]